MTWMPTVSEERRMAVGAPTQWKSYSLLARCGFFVLAVICGGALFGFVAVISDSGRIAAIVAGVLALATAEYLILRFRFFGAGLEEALWLGGALGIVLGVAWDANWRTLTVIAAVAALAAAVRLLNPLFAVVAAVLPAWRFDAHGGAYCAVLAVVALILVPLPRRRPSLDYAIGALAVVMPLAAYLFAKGVDWNFEPQVAAALLLYAIAALILGLRFRLHAPLLALFPTLGALAYEIRNLTGMSVEARLIVWGSVVLAVSIAIERYLKVPRRGITSRQLKDDQLGDLLQLAGIVAIAPHAQPAERGGPRLEEGGSSFGGAGAGGDF